MATDYFDILEKSLDEHELLDKPHLISTVMKQECPSNQKHPRVIAEVGVKTVSHITSNTKSQLTVLGAVNAAGHYIPPFVIFNRKSLNPEWTKGEVPNTSYGLSSKGWVDTELFQDWFIEHFLAYAPKCRPLLLLMNGHSSHFSPEMIRFAAHSHSFHSTA